jgi:hypothetical protein
MEKQNRDHALRVMVTQDERDTLFALAAKSGQSVSSYVRVIIRKQFPDAAEQIPAQSSVWD